jgi:UDP-N-acetylglucosamine diphosphorylase/glucosamine-1-phosphate N-acetyltransferase
MRAMRVCLFEDRGCQNLEPLALMRPVFDLLCGQTSLASKQLRFFAPCEVGVLIRPQLADLYRLHHPRIPINDATWLRSAPIVLVNGRWLPPAGVAINLAGPAVATVGDEVVYAVLGTEQLADCSSHTIDDCLETWKQTLPVRPASGFMISYLWDLIEHNAEQIALDSRGAIVRPMNNPISVIGPEKRLHIDPTARLDPMVVADTTNGPVVIDYQAVIHSFSRLEGPCYVGPHTQILGAKIRAGSSVGPHCRIGGEVEASIVQGYSNKYHDGFLGHSYVGEWVNIGAGVQTSDLRNDYGEVSVIVNGERVASGSHKVGSFIGDHTKIGLGTLLNTGSNIGIFCNLLPSGSLLPKYVPSFASWWNGSLVDKSNVLELERIAGAVMRRRGWAFSDVHAALVRKLHEQAAAERRRATVQADARRLRRSA